MRPHTFPLRHFLFTLLMALLPLFANRALLAQDTGIIEGKVTDESTKEPVIYANVVLKGTSLGATTDYKGVFQIDRVPPGEYAVLVSIVGYRSREIAQVSVTEGQTTSLEFGLQPSPVQVSEVQVYGASLRRERITEAPAAVTIIEAHDFKLYGAQAQLPKLLENEPGVDIAQSGLYDFNINTRGFNSSLNRRLLVLLDGRDLAIAFLGAQEWNGLSVPVEDLGRMELVRGPGSALYGANAFNGVINIITPPPKQVIGTKVAFAGGELNSLRADLRHADAFDAWSYKVNVGRFQSSTWSESRVLPPFEYSGFGPLNVEIIPVDKGRITSSYGSGRIDYDLEDGSTLIGEGGISQVENEIYVTGIGRVQVKKAQKPWGRVSYTTSAFNAQVWASGRSSKEPQVSLSTGLPLHEKSYNIQGDFQYRFSLLDEKLFIVSGVSYRVQSVDTKGTLMLEKHNDNMSGVYGQFEYHVLDNLKAVAAARWDRSTLYSGQFSPKGALVWSIESTHSLRLTYNRAFQSPNYSELYLNVLHPTSALAYLGNANLIVEKINGFEIGYKGIFDNSLFLTFDVYYNQLEDFITDLAPGINPAYPGLVRIGGRDRTVWSYGNAGEVEERGFEVGVNYYLSDEWVLNSNYALFDFEVIEKHRNDILLPNAPKHKVNGGVTFTSRHGFEIGMKVKYVPTFTWAAGIFNGPILAYTVVDLSGRYHLTENFDLAVSVANLLDRKHYQIFGGSLLGRRAIASLTATF